MAFTRFPVSLKFDEDSALFVNTVGVLRDQKTLSTVITLLLELYHEDAELRHKVNKRMSDSESIQFQSLIVQFERIAVEHQKNMLATSALKEHIDSNSRRLYDIDVSAVQPSQEELEIRGNSLLESLGIGIAPATQPVAIEAPQVVNEEVNKLTMQMADMQKMMLQLMNMQTGGQSSTVTSEVPVQKAHERIVIDNSESHTVPFKFTEQVVEPAVTVAKKPYTAVKDDADDGAPIVNYPSGGITPEAPVSINTDDSDVVVTKKPSSFNKLAKSMG